MSARWEIRFTKQAKKDVERLPPKLSFEISSSKFLPSTPMRGRNFLAI